MAVAIGTGPLRELRFVFVTAPETEKFVDGMIRRLARERPDLRIPHLAYDGSRILFHVAIPDEWTEDVCDAVQSLVDARLVLLDRAIWLGVRPI